AALCDGLYTPIDNLFEEHLKSIRLKDIAKDLKETS
ncbi:MAG: Rrf2 family transcriptional regulator, partial [Erysipelothrix sp.]|nr:Rrf2 family transcriptional regulator [Erysipelothrix sp.]